MPAGAILGLKSFIEPQAHQTRRQNYYQHHTTRFCHSNERSCDDGWHQRPTSSELKTRTQGVLLAQRLLKLDWWLLNELLALNPSVARSNRIAPITSERPARNSDAGW